MPGTPEPVGDGPNGMPKFVWAIIQGLTRTTQATSQLNAGSTAGLIVDQYGNAVEVSGTNLNQVVTIGASHGQAGVLVGTGQSNGTAGRVKQSALHTTTVTLTKGSATATLAGSGPANGQVIGAANVTDPTTGIATPAITPGTTVSSGGGTTTLTLSAVAAESGSGLFCASATFS